VYIFYHYVVSYPIVVIYGESSNNCPQHLFEHCPWNPQHLVEAGI